jgi:hypothetical protein
VLMLFNHRQRRCSASSRKIASALQDASKLQNAALAKATLTTACGVADAYRIATRLLAAADASMSYETAQKVQQQQLKDRVVYAVILLLGFVALYINIKRAANEHAEWEKSHS